MRSADRLSDRRTSAGARRGASVRLPVVPTTDLSRPIGLAPDAAGTLHIADFDNDRVVKLPMRGGQRTLPVAGLHTPAGVAVPPPARTGYRRPTEP
ncbi:hypothetical protein AB0387_25515 [Streptomyces sp. NPDC089173]|uniref:hypothetical protein n=1 Tax=Streptomyces sp. NPDC089173 TaxID=3154965 RepID=UPI00344FBC75